MFATFTLALGLCMDSLAAAMAMGTAHLRRRWGDAMRVGLVFAACQTAIPAAGALAGFAVARRVADWDHWIAFGLLSLVGAEMIFHACRGRPEDSPSPSWRSLALTGVGTSLDAGIVGIGLGMTDPHPALTIAVIGAITFVTSVAGVICGRWACARAGTLAQGTGGVILIGIGIRILTTHLSGSI